MSEITDILDGLAAGRLGLREVVANFAAREWPPDRPPAPDYETEALRELDDPGLIPENSWLEVEAAYLGGDLPEGLYRVLYQARASSPVNSSS